MTNANILINNIDPNAEQYTSGIDLNDYYFIEGNGFGSDDEYVYYNDMEKFPLGEIFAGNNDGLWVMVSGGLSISSDLAHTGTRSFKKEYFNKNDFPKTYLRCPGQHDYVYFSCYWRYETLDLDGVQVWIPGKTYVLNEEVQKGSTRYKCNVPTSLGVDPETDYSHSNWSALTSVWKLSRIGNIYNDPYHPTRYNWDITGTMPKSSAPSLFTDEEGYSRYAAHNTASFNTLTQLTPNTWHFYETFAYAGTLGNNDSFLEIKIDGKTAVRFDNGKFRTYTSPDAIRAVMTPINGLDNSWQVGKSNTRMWMDEVFMTTSLKRVIMTDSPNFATSTMWCAQPHLPKAWRSTRVICKAVRGNFIQGSTAYLHIIDYKGVVVHTKQITVK